MTDVSTFAFTRGEDDVVNVRSILIGGSRGSLQRTPLAP